MIAQDADPVPYHEPLIFALMPAHLEAIHRPAQTVLKLIDLGLQAIKA